jgi:hypothetical protein
MIDFFVIHSSLDPNFIFGILTIGVLSLTLTIEPKQKVNSQQDARQNKVDKLVMKQRFEPRDFVK